MLAFTYLSTVFICSECYNSGAELHLVDGLDVVVFLDDAVIRGVELDLAELSLLATIFLSIQLELNLLKQGETRIVSVRSKMLVGGRL